MDELRFQVPREQLQVLDGYCNATGKTRTDVLRMLLADWSKETLHVSTVVCRVAGVNPRVSESSRSRNG